MLIDDEPKPVKLHDWNILPKSSVASCVSDIRPAGTHKKKKYLSSITWNVSDLSKAGCLLHVPPLPVEFDDEEEMRRVYSLIYDVFRYKNVLGHALNDVAFFQIYPKLATSAQHVWLLFYDLYHRGFKKRETSVAPLAFKLFDSVGLSYPENALWSQRVRLAAAVARLRIQNNALSLDKLLPAHLKDEKLTDKLRFSPVTCWVNSMKVENIKELVEDIEKTFDLKMAFESDKLEKDRFKWDRHCPQIMTFHSSMRGRLARSVFVKNHLLVVQDKSFCRGAATFGKILLDLNLTGSVIQTHVNSPRTTAYLATLLANNEKIKKLMAFSAGSRKPEYETYFTELGIVNIKLFADRLIDSPPDTLGMEEVVAVFATPPSTYSAVADPIDLVCARGGDLYMLEVLTESEDSKEAKERVLNILEEQKKTLRFAMSRPQIQFVLYETHSALEAENDGMVNKTLNDINKLAKLQHATLLGKAVLSEMALDENDSEMKLPPPGDGNTVANKLMDAVASSFGTNSKEKLLNNIQVPDTDLFTIPDLPSLCPGDNTCSEFKKDGCFLSLIQRKEVIRLDDKYMIQMAENRGLFGSGTTQSSVKSKGSKAVRKKDKTDRKNKTRKKLKELEIDRIAAPTHTFLSHIKHEVPLCKRCQLEQDKSLRAPLSQPKKWWCESTRHIIDLKKYLAKHKLLPSQRFRRATQANIVESLSASAQMVDGCSQTWDDFEDDSSSSSLDEDEGEGEEEMLTASRPGSSAAVSRPSSRNILSRLTSAHIRQFVSPDFKQDYFNFHVPSLTLSGGKSRRPTSKSAVPERASTVSKLVTEEPRNSIMRHETSKRMSGKRERKFKKYMLDRLCMPTLSFILKTSKQAEAVVPSKGNVLEPRSSPCERFNRRNP